MAHAVATADGSRETSVDSAPPPAEFSALKTLVEVSLGLNQNEQSSRTTASPSKLSHSSSLAPPLNGSESDGNGTGFDREASILLIGMRGVGKTTLGLMLATYLNRPFIDADRVFERIFSTTIKDVIPKHGWEYFRNGESAILKNLLRMQGKGAVIALGGGVVELEENRALLMEWSRMRKPCIHVCRNFGDVVSYLHRQGTKSTWAPFVESVQDIYNRRIPWYLECSNLTFVTLSRSTNTHPALALKHVEPAIQRMGRVITDQPSPFQPFVVSWTGPRTSCLVISGSDAALHDATELELVSRGVDVLELRVDTLGPPPSPQPRSLDPFADPELVGTHHTSLPMAILRHRSHLPLMFTLRTSIQGGLFSGSREAYLELVKVGFRRASDFVDVELILEDTEIEQLMAFKRSRSQVIMSYTWSSEYSREMRWNSAEVEAMYRRAVRLGADVVRLSLPAHSISTNFEASILQSTLSAEEGSIPLVAICTGQAGSMSRILNPVLTPVTHPRLRLRDEPGSLSQKELEQGLRLNGLIPPRVLADFVPGGFSPLSAIIREGVRELGLSYEFIPAVEANLLNFVSRADFGGAVIHESTASLPPLIQATVAARAIGFADVAFPSSSSTSNKFGGTPSPRRVLVENCRSLAIQTVIKRHLSPVNLLGRWTTALVHRAEGQVGREVVWALRALGVTRIFAVQCSEAVLPVFNSSSGDESSTVPPTRSILPAASPPPELSICRLDSISSLTRSAAHRLPSIVIYCPPSSSSPVGSPSLSPADVQSRILPPCLVELSTGGVILDLCTSQHATTSDDDGWIRTTGFNVDQETANQAFSALTSKRLPADLVAC
ncbi:SKI-domain-containing protein [Meredithblackwellia eburnea MCA 4105]